MKKNCVICDAEFETKRNHAKYCGSIKCQRESNRLKMKRYREGRKEVLDDTIVIKPTSIQTKHCESCGCEIPFNGSKISYSKKKFCSMKCLPSEQKSRKAELATIRRRKRGVKPKVIFVDEEHKRKHERQVRKKWRDNLSEEKREEKRAKRREYRKRSYVREKERQDLRQYHAKNPHKKKEYYLNYESNVMHRLTRRIRNSVRASLIRQGSKKKRPTFDLLGFTKEELRAHLESQFTDGMSWENMGEWHIDHIRPVASFNYDSTGHPEFKQCWALENLQPMWAIDNLSKGSLWEGKRYRRKVVS